MHCFKKKNTYAQKNRTHTKLFKVEEYPLRVSEKTSKATIVFIIICISQIISAGNQVSSSGNSFL